ncbi:PD-(D/E)XK nuclease family protein [Candidatus Synechococcus calcipolaris G9]|uniref:PD-(D/E)XK nuclease family protein n=1 Tax=Candidatus Synechococcus calcipolaris G9 TaxID=1497997 RepID=A0ABT6F2P0_9SYNE|nr:PD-(D/E)XK nuclease family protein [Candidatus Synechococcus calcipolaris]MDG2992127.1 PD-(D/E)XK nuclease family protein [Candidatus Synechococcus calcipolaris G9]
MIHQLSQGHLQTLNGCPRKFQYLYLDHYTLPSLPQQLNRQRLGTDFHRLMHQESLGLDIAPLIAADGDMERWYQTFQTSPPPMISGRAESEHCRSVALGAFTLVGIYDRVIFGPTQAQIIDWKTYARPPEKKHLSQHWQTRLYPFLLAATSDYTPENICMTYWFAEGSEPPQYFSFAYGVEIHRQICDRLEAQLSRLQTWLDRYEQNPGDHPLPQIPQEMGRCSYCPFVHRCERFNPEAESQKLDVAGLLGAIASIPELPI